MATSKEAKADHTQTPLTGAQVAWLAANLGDATPQGRAIKRLCWNLRQAWGAANYARKRVEKLLEEKADSVTAAELLDRQPPNSPEAERAAIGAVLLKPEKFAAMKEVLAPTDFYDDSHRTIWNALVAIREDGRPIDTVTLVDELQANDEYHEVGGWLIAQILQGCPTTANAEYYAAIVKRHSAKRAQLHGALAAIKGVWE